MSARIISIGVAIVLLGVLAYKSLFVVRIDQYAIVTNFGEPVAVHAEPGLFARVPFVQEVRYFDKRIQAWDDIAKDTKTLDSRQIDYTVFARWRIADPLNFYKSVGSERQAHATMDSVVTDRIQKAIRSRKLVSLVRGSERNFEARAAVDLRSIFDTYPECNPDVNPEFRKALAADVTLGEAARKLRASEPSEAMRATVVKEILEDANVRLREEFGIEIADLHFKYLNYSQKVHDDIIKQIEADRSFDISSYIEVGKKCVGYINRITDAERGQILGEGERRVRELDGKATADAIDIKAKAFGQDMEFYRFLRMLELYRDAFAKDTRLVLSGDHPVLALLRDRGLLSAPVSGHAPAGELPSLPMPKALPPPTVPTPAIP